MTGSHEHSYGTTGRDEQAYAAALAGLPGMGPATLTGLLGRFSPVQAWEEIRAARVVRPALRRQEEALFSDGRPSPPAPDRGGAGRREWAMAASRIDPPRWWAAHARKGVQVTWPGQASYPRALDADPEKPGVLFWLGSLDRLEQPCVAIVGTRSATPDGKSVAFEMARDLAGAGVCVVSGMALGIDGQAHAGALRAVAGGAAGTTVGVAASGVDVPYPRMHAAMWWEVARAGAIISENLPGRAAQAWRFPSRNRVIAGLVRLVVVVESHERGGSLITAEAAIARGVEVRVVPGSVHSPASAGTNQLLYDGPGPVRDAQDVLDALGTFESGPGATRFSARETRQATGPDGEVLDAMGWRPVTIGQVMARTGRPAPEVAAALDRLSGIGSVSEEGGYWARKARAVPFAPPAMPAAAVPNLRSAPGRPTSCQSEYPEPGERA